MLHQPLPDPHPLPFRNLGAASPQSSKLPQKSWGHFHKVSDGACMGFEPRLDLLCDAGRVA